MRDQYTKAINISNQSIVGCTKNYISCNEDKKEIIVTESRKNNFSWAMAAADRLPDFDREDVFTNAFGELPESTDLGNYKIENWYEDKHIQSSCGKDLCFSRERCVIPLGEGLVNFLHADFVSCAKKVEIQTPDKRYEKENKKWYLEEEQIVYDYLCLSETMKYVGSVIDLSVYTALFPPVMCARTSRHISNYFHYLELLQNDVKELVQLVFDPDYYPKELGALSANQRLALYLKLKGYQSSFEYIYNYSSLTYENDPEIALPLDEIHRRRRSTEEGCESGFYKEYGIRQQELEDYARLPFYFFPRIEIKGIPEMLMFEVLQMLRHNVALKKCKHCGRYFVVKGKHKANYCSRIVAGKKQTCQNLAAQEKNRKKEENEPAVKVYKRYYGRYLAQVKSRQMKKEDFQQWKYQASVKRDECKDGLITIGEYENWLEESAPGGKKTKES